MPNAFLDHDFQLSSIGSIARMTTEWNYYLKWVSDHIIGKPKATKHYSVQKLESMNVIGLYKKTEPVPINPFDNCEVCGEVELKCFC